jgi:hypothetical protein
MKAKVFVCFKNNFLDFLFFFCLRKWVNYLHRWFYIVVATKGIILLFFEKPKKFFSKGFFQIKQRRKGSNPFFLFEAPDFLLKKKGFSFRIVVFF